MCPKQDKIPSGAIALKNKDINCIMCILCFSMEWCTMYWRVV